MLRTVRNRIIRKVASRHIAGPELNDAVKVCLWAGDKGYGTILSPWAAALESDSNVTGAAANIKFYKEMLHHYINSIDAVRGHNLNSYVSVKLNAVGYDQGIIRELLEYAAGCNTRIHVDSLDPDSASKAFALLDRNSVFHEHLGYTLPSRWMRSPQDAERAIDLGIAVRIVKGQWEDTGNIKPDCRKNYIAIAEKLAGKARYVGVATHDVSLAEEALDLLIAQHTYCEFEQFFSLPLNGFEQAHKRKIPYRLYVAYGHPGIPYNIRFALTRPSLAVWMGADYAFKPRRPWSEK